MQVRRCHLHPKKSYRSCPLPEVSCRVKEVLFCLWWRRIHWDQALHSWSLDSALDFRLICQNGLIDLPGINGLHRLIGEFHRSRGSWVPDGTLSNLDWDVGTWDGHRRGVLDETVSTGLRTSSNAMRHLQNHLPVLNVSIAQRKEDELRMVHWQLENMTLDWIFWFAWHFNFNLSTACEMLPGRRSPWEN